MQLELHAALEAPLGRGATEEGEFLFMVDLIALNSNLVFSADDLLQPRNSNRNGAAMSRTGPIHFHHEMIGKESSCAMDPCFESSKHRCDSNSSASPVQNNKYPQVLEVV